MLKELEDKLQETSVSSQTFEPTDKAMERVRVEVMYVTFKHPMSCILRTGMCK